MVEVIRAPWAVRSTCLMVSTAGRPTMAAPCSDDGVDGAVDGGGVDERADGVVDQDNVVGLGGQGGQGVGDRLLAVVAAFDHADAAKAKPYSAIWAWTRSISACARPRRSP
jgi:hypothetical protein